MAYEVDLGGEDFVLGLPFDPYTDFQNTRKTMTKRNSVAYLKKQEAASKKPKLVTLKRLVETHSRSRLMAMARHTINEMGAFGEPPTLGKRLGASILDESKARFILSKYFQSPERKQPAGIDFNQIVKEHARTINQSNPSVDVKLGKVATFGSGSGGNSYVGITLEGAGAQRLASDFRGLLSLLDQRFSTGPIEATPSTPHLSLIVVPPGVSAEAYVEPLSSNLAILKATGIEAVTLGRAV